MGASQPRPHIRELRLRKFRAFENARLQLNDLTVIVGRNGSGKSTILEAFDFLQDAVTHSLVVALERRGGVGSIVHRPSDKAQKDYSSKSARRNDAIRPPSISSGFEIAIDISLPATNAMYGFAVVPTRTNRAGFNVRKEVLQTYPKSFSFWRTGGKSVRKFFKTDIKGVTNVDLPPDTLALPVVAGVEPVWQQVLDVLRSLLVYDISPQAMQAEPRIGSQRALARDGSNIGDVIRRLDGDDDEMKWVIRHLESVTRGIQDVQATASAGRRIVNFFQNTGERTSRFTAAEMSNGTLHCLGVLMALRQEPIPSLVFIDEIEASIHTAALSALMDAAAVTSEERCQVVISSHSTDALSHEAVSADNVRIVDWQGDRSEIFRVNDESRDLLTPPESVGRLLRSNSLWTRDDPEIVAKDIFEVQQDAGAE
ncbi:MAG: ATP-binding protein [Planctomycetota bacterium]